MRLLQKSSLAKNQTEIKNQGQPVEDVDSFTYRENVPENERIGKALLVKR